MSHTIIRARRRHRYVIVDQRAVEDSRLSWAARGLLAYLLSRPNDWKVLVNDLKRRGDLKRDGIHKLLRELRNAGYVRFERQRDRHGRIRGGTYFVQEVPDGPQPESPDTVDPETARPCPAKPAALPITDRNLRPTTTTIPTTTYSKFCGHRPAAQIAFAKWVPSELHAPAKAMVARLPPERAQMIVDEWAGVLARGSIRRSALGYLRALITRSEDGAFSPKLADRVARVRK